MSPTPATPEQIALAALWLTQPATGRLYERFPNLISTADSRLLAIAAEAARLAQSGITEVGCNCIIDAACAKYLTHLRNVEGESQATVQELDGMLAGLVI